MWQQFICRACGLIYDEQLGDPDSGLPAGTRFADIPEDWACPLCGVTKADFEPHTVQAVDRTSTLATAPVLSVRGGRAPADGGVVIVGGGMAAWAVAQALRAHDSAQAITLVAACDADIYSKPMLSLALGNRETAQTLVRETGATAAARLGVRLLAHTQAVGIDARARRLRTTRGTLPYRNLVLAMGAQPVPVPALPPERVWRINHLQAWLQMRAQLGAEPRRVVVVGAGLVGCEIADDLAHAGHHVTVLDVAARPLAQWASAAQAEALLRQWADHGVGHGVCFVGGVSVLVVEPDGANASPYAVVTHDGQRFVADVVIAATGLRTDPRLAKSAGLLFDNGIAVSPATLCTSDPNIYALGDCISINGQPCRFIEPIAAQARAIAAGLAGQAEPEPHVHRMPLVRLKTRSLPLTLSR